MILIKDVLKEKFNQEFDGKIDPYKYFFGQIINNITTLDSKDVGYAEHNFSGLHSVSNDGNSSVVTEFLIDALRLNGKHCDVGASIARLSKKLIDKGFDSYAIDGHDYGIRHKNIQIPLEKYSVCNMSTTDITQLDFEKHFDITTAFEITEHIPENEIDLFYKNCAYMSKRHVCSVHWGGDDNTKNPNHNHYNVKPTEWWIEFLTKFGRVRKLYFDIPTFTESDLLLIDFY